MRQKTLFSRSALLCAALVLLGSAPRSRAHHADPYETEDLHIFDQHRQKEPEMERPDSFLSVLRKMIHKYPMIKSRMYMMFKQDFDTTGEFGSNPSTGFGDFAASSLDPRQVYLKFKAIIDADQMLKEDMQKLLRRTQNIIDMQKMKKKNWLANIKDLERDLSALKERKSRATDEITATEIENQFAVKYKMILKYFDAYRSAEKWEKELNRLLGELLA